MEPARRFARYKWSTGSAEPHRIEHVAIPGDLFVVFDLPSFKKANRS
jgi:hypothetical protein